MEATMTSGMDLKEQLVIWKKAQFLVDNMAWTPRLQVKLVEEGVITSSMLADIEAHRFHVERKLHLLTLLGTHNTGVFSKFLRALEHTDHCGLVKELQRTLKLIKFGEMLPPSFTYFLDVSEFLRRYPHIGLKLGEDGKRLLHTFIEGKLEMKGRKTSEQLQNLKAENARLVAEMKKMAILMAESREKQLAAESLWATSGGRIVSLEARVHELEEVSRKHLEEIRHLQYVQTLQDDVNDFMEREYKEYLPAQSENSAVTTGYSDKVTMTATNFKKLQLLRSQVSLNVVRFDLLRTSIQNVVREERRVQDLHDDIIRPRAPTEEIDNTLKKEVSEFLSEITAMRTQLENQFKEGENELLFHEQLLKAKEKEYNIKSETNFRSHLDLIPKLKALLENMKKVHARKVREKEARHERDMDDMIERLQKLNQKHKEDVDKLRGTIRRKMLEIHRREQLHRKLRHQIRVMENYQSRNMNSTVSVEQCRKIVRAIIGEARILRDLSEEKEVDLQENKIAKGNKDRGAKGKGRKGRKRKIPDSLAEDRLRYMAGKVHRQWRPLGHLLGLTDNRMDIVEMDAGSGSGERMAFYMLKVWRDEEGGRPRDLAMAFLRMGLQELATLLVPMSTMGALRAALEQEDSDGQQQQFGGDSRHFGSDFMAAVPTLPKIPVL